jgi:hypothetical protein
MLNKEMMQEILDMKAAGFTVGEIRARLAERGGQAPSLSTIRKYYNMGSAPDEPGANLAKPKAFDVEPFRSSIIQIVTANPKCQISSVHDVLVERFVEGGAYDGLPANEQTLRNFVRHLKESGPSSRARQGGAPTITSLTPRRPNIYMNLANGSESQRLLAKEPPKPTT